LLSKFSFSGLLMWVVMRCGSIFQGYRSIFPPKLFPQLLLWKHPLFNARFGLFCVDIRLFFLKMRIFNGLKTRPNPFHMKFTLCLLFLICLGLPAPAQQLQEELDSLSLLIEARTVPDTALVDLRNLYAKKALFAHPSDSGLLDFGQKTLELAKELQYGKGTMMAHERLALIHQYSFSNPYKAQEAYHNALSVMEGNPSLKALGWSIYGGIGTLYYEQEEYGKALDYRSEEHTSELQSRENLVCRLLLEKI